MEASRFPPAWFLLHYPVSGKQLSHHCIADLKVINPMARNKKYELIVKTYELLKTQSPDDLTIRRIAEEAGCTSTVIYRHFENLDHLILLASVRFLEDYIDGLSNLLGRDSDPLTMLREMWVVFGVQAFAHVEVFEMLFWGRYTNQLSDAIIQYYQLFPEKWRSTNGVEATIFFSGNIEERNLIAVNRAAAEGYLPLKNIRLFSDIQCHLFHSIMLKYKDEYHSPGKAEKGLQEFMRAYDFLIDAYRLK